jgi:sugar lactone lactonase YvrE
VALRAEVALEVGAQIGEGPVWDERAQELLFVDIMGERVHGWRPSDHSHRSFAVGRPVGAVVLREDGGLVLAAHDNFFLVEADGSGLRQIGSANIDGSAVRFNDGKVDPWGRFLAGTMDWGHKDPVGSLYMLSCDGSVTTLLEGAVISNGLAWSADGTTLYYIDTRRESVDAFDVDRETGKLSRRRVVTKTSDGRPDGMAIDDEGCLWVALWGGSRVECIDPAGGRRLAVIELPTTHVSSAAFGGAHLDELYITTATDRLSRERLAAEPHAGDLFVAHPGVSGPPPNRFRLA